MSACCQALTQADSHGQCSILIGYRFISWPIDPQFGYSEEQGLSRRGILDRVLKHPYFSPPFPPQHLLPDILRG